MPKKGQVSVVKIKTKLGIVKEATSGNNVTVIFESQEMPSDYYAGCVLSNIDFPIPVTDEFIGQISLKSGNFVISAGFSCTCICNGFSGDITFIRLLAEHSPKNYAVKKRNPKFVLGGSIVVAHMCAIKPFCLEKFKVNKRLGHFTIVNLGDTIGFGKVISVHKPMTRKEIQSLTSNWPNSFIYLDTLLMDDILCFFMMYLSKNPILQMLPIELMGYIAKSVITVYYLEYYSKT